MAAMTTLLLAGSLTACGNGEAEAGLVSHDEIAESMRRLANEGEFFQSGQWQSTSEILQLDGASESEAAELKSKVGRQTFSTCLSEEEVSQPEADFFTGAASDCVYSRFVMGEGRIEAAMRCVTGTIVQDNILSGTYAPDRYDFTLTSTGAPPDGERMVMTISARRVGDCARLGPPRTARSTGEK